jgi:GMP synthase PP-ATPase subunit
MSSRYPAGQTPIRLLVVSGVVSVTYNVTRKPPSTIEAV